MKKVAIRVAAMIITLVIISGFQIKAESKELKSPAANYYSTIEAVAAEAGI